MKSQISTGAVMIALRYFPTGGRSFGPGDKFPYQELDFTERRLNQMVESRHIGPLTRESYARALQTQGPDYIGTGFTRDGLVAMGILDAKGKAARAAPAPEPKTTDGWSPPADQYQVTELFNGIWLAGSKRGVSTRFDLFDQKGNKLNPGATLNGLANAKEAANQIIATAAAEDAKKQTEPKPLFADYPADLADWSDEQLFEFDAWYAAIPADDTTPHKLLPAAAERFKQLQDVDAQKPALFADHPEDLADWSPDQLKAFDDWFFAQEAAFEPEEGQLAPAGVKRFAGLDTYAAMDDSVLIAILTDEGLKPTGTESHRELVELALMIPASTEGTDSDTPDAEEQKEGEDGGDVRSGTGDGEGSGSPEAG